MPNFSLPHDPSGTYEPSFMTTSSGGGIAGTVTDTCWNTCIPGSPVCAGANVLSNCTGYAQGRMLDIYIEITGFDPTDDYTHPFTMFNQDAGQWRTIAENNGFTVLDEPVEGSVLVTGSHVAVVEYYDSDNDEWWISESGYGDSTAYHYHTSLYKSGNSWYSSYASDPLVIGFIKIPETQPGPTPSVRSGYDRRRRYRNV